MLSSKKYLTIMMEIDPHAQKKMLDKYKSVLQLRALLADPQNLIGEIGRGSGKTTEILSPRIDRIINDMPKSILGLAAPSYTYVLETIVPGLLTYFNKYYTRGKYFEYGKQPPASFDRPYTEIPAAAWKHSICFKTGTVIQFIGVDRPNTSGAGKNLAHVAMDEMLRISETNFVERVAPAKRSERDLFGASHYYGGITGFSSSPNLENDHDWWLSLEENMDKDKITEIMYVAGRVMQKQAEILFLQEELNKVMYRNLIKQAHIEKKLKSAYRFVEKWGGKLTVQRRQQTYYMKGSSFTNLAVLGLDYMKEQYSVSTNNIEKFKLSILGIRPNAVKNRFFSQFGSKNIFEDSYLYDNIDLYSVDDKGYQKSSSDLKYCDSRRPILMGLDPGNFMSAVFAQEQRNTMYIFKDMYVITPEEHFALAQKINNFFRNHGNRTIYLWYDRAGNKKLEKYQTNRKGDTDAKILRTELENFGWTVHLMSTDQRTIFYYEHYFLNSRLMSEREKQTPQIRVCQNECERLISSINMSPLKRTEDGNIILDKSSEKKLDYEDQPYWSTQIASAMTYLIFGKYEKWMPDGKRELTDYEGL